MKPVVTLTDPVITVTNWPAQLDAIGNYKLRLRKTPEEMRAERESLKKLTGNPRPKVNPNKFQFGTVLKHDPNKEGTVYFLPGLWPRIRAAMDTAGIEYDIVDNRDMSIRPQIDFDAIKDVQFRPTQDLALALVANSDCGIIETTTAWGKCLGKETNVFDASGDLVNVDSLYEGQPILGWDSFSNRAVRREIKKITRGCEMLYKYTSEEGVIYRFTGDHMLVLMNDVALEYPEGDKHPRFSQIYIKVRDYMQLPADLKKHLFAMRVCGIRLDDDGMTYSYRWMRDEVNKFDAFRSTYIAPTILRSCFVTRLSMFLCYMRSILGKQGFKTDWAMAGVINVDVYYESFAKDFVTLVRSVGLKAVYAKVNKYWSITIYGDNLRHIKIPADPYGHDMDRAAYEISKKMDAYVPMRFKIEEDKVDDWVGFELGQIQQGATDVDGTLETTPLFLLEDYTLTHNSFLISVICRAFPTLNIVVCTSSASVVGTLYQYLNEQLPGQIGQIGGGKDTTAGKRVIVSTLKSVSHIPHDKVQLLLCDECHDVGATKSGEDLMQFCFCRKFGFSASPVRADGSKIVMESIFGPTILKMTYDQAVQEGMVTPMKYVMLHCERGLPFDAQTTPDFIRKRLAYWKNAARNQTIADFVKDVLAVAPDTQILIIVATLEAAISLQIMLPQFLVANYGSVDVDEIRKHFPVSKYPHLNPEKYKMSKNQLERMRNAFAKGTLKRIISTFVFRQGVNFVHLRLLVRADGTTSEVAGIQIPGRLSRLDKDKDYAYLVDLDDTFNPWAKNRAISRRVQYDKQGWTQITREQLINDFRNQALVDSGSTSGEDTTEPEC